MCLSETSDSPVLVDCWNDARGALIFLLRPAGPSDSLNSCSPWWCALVLVVVAIKALITPHGISCHLVWPFEERLILNLFQYLVHWLSEHSINYISVGRF